MYLRSGKRHPVLWRNRWLVADVQGRVPVDWCQNCGGEIFEDGQRQCVRCKGRKEHDEVITKSMYILPARE